MSLAGPGALQGGAYVVALGQRDLGVVQGAFVLEAGQPPRHQQAPGVVAYHLHQLGLDELAGGYGHSEGDAAGRELQGLRVDRLQRAEYAPGDAEPRLCQAREGRGESLRTGQPVGRRNPYAVEDQLAGVGCAEAHLALHRVRREARSTRRDDEPHDSCIAPGPYEHEIGYVAVADPHLRAVDDVIAAVPAGRRAHGRRVGAAVVLRQREAPDQLSSRDAGQVLADLAFGAIRQDGVHDQPGLHTGEAPETGVYALQLVHDQSVGGVGGASSAVLHGHIGADHAKLAQLRHEVTREDALLPPVGDVRRGLRFQECAGGCPGL